MIVTTILENLSAFVFCGFAILFVVPAVLVQLFYMLPGAVYYAVKGRVHLRAVWQPVGQALLWLVIMAALYAVTYLLNQQSFFYVSTSAMAFFCWIAGGVSMLLRFAFQTERIQNDFYENLYLKNATEPCRKAFKEYVQYVDTLYMPEVRALLDKKGLNFLERKVLLNRAALLVGRV